MPRTPSSVPRVALPGGAAAAPAVPGAIGPAAPVPPPTIGVTDATPLPGTSIDRIPASVTSISRDEIVRTRSPDVVRTLQGQTPSITVTESAGNCFQPDAVSCGFEASPVADTQQGLAVYQNGVRIAPAICGLARHPEPHTPTQIHPFQGTATSPISGA